LASLERHLDEPYEVIVVDNASDDRTVAVAESWSGPLSVVRLGENRGFGAGSNAGVAAANAASVVLLNPDTHLVDGSLLDLAALAVRRRALCGPELLNDDLSRQPSASPVPGGWEVCVDALFPAALMPRPLRELCEPWRARDCVEVGWLTGACIAAPRDLLLELGPFDESIEMYAEDLDLGLRARQRGVPSLFAPDVARVVHVGGRSAASRFPDAGLRLKVANRRIVTRRRLGRRREYADVAAQVAFHGSRWVAKRLLRRDVAREAAWLRTTFRSAGVAQRNGEEVDSERPGEAVEAQAGPGGRREAGRETE
jgi:N-acetylglucosaminyl-diphospho-decaprenol L-rhamnosyltransferase